MKSTVETLLCLLLAACMILSLTACGAQKAEEQPAAQDAETAPAADAAEFKTMGDVFAYDNLNSGYSDTHYVYVFEKDGEYFRATAEIPADVSEALWGLDFFAEDHDEQEHALIAPLEIINLENLSERIPSQEELDALVGRTGQELKDDGWSIWSWQLDEMEFGMYHGPFAYTVVMEGDFVPNENYDFDEDADFAPLTVKSVAFDGIGDATADVLDAGNEGESELTWYDDDESLEDGQNPVMNFIGVYQSGRAHALVECVGSDSAQITIEWGASAWESAQWVIVGALDLDTLTIEYTDGVQSILTYGDDGALESEELVYEDGTGTIVFHDDGTFTWHDDRSEYDEDMVFEWLPAADPQIANPWREITEDEARELCPNSFGVPEGAENAVWSALDAVSDPSGVPGTLVQLSFDLYGMSFTAREQVTGDREDDQSGMYYDWTYQLEMELTNWPGERITGKYFRYIGENEYADLCTWYDAEAGVSYSLSTAAPDLDGFDLQAIAEALYAPRNAGD